jgi:hypothetical protein
LQAGAWTVPAFLCIGDDVALATGP